MSAEHHEIGCAEARERLAMLLYGELSFGEEETLESHLRACQECQAVLVRQKALHAALDAAEIEPSPSLLRECREDLRASVANEPTVEALHSGWRERLTHLFGGPWVLRTLRPAGALALVAVGFFGGRFAPAVTPEGRGMGSAAMGEPVSRVREVEPASSGRVRIVLEETRQRVVSGRLDDLQVQAMILGAAKDPSDPGLRAESVEILNGRADEPEVRDVLISALRHDQNAGVRLKAMEGLKSFAGQPEVRRAFTEVLLGDANPGLRTQAIDLLTGLPDRVDRQTVGALQELIERGESQDYVRARSLRVLQAMKASAESY